RHVIEVMQRYTQIKASAREDDVALALVADAELFRLEGIVRWLDAADARLRQLSSKAPTTPVVDAPLEETRPMEVSQCLPHSNCGRCPRSTTQARPKSTRSPRSTSRSSAASSWR